MIEDYIDIEPIPEHGNDFIADVSTRYFVCEDINYLNEMRVISKKFNSWKDADSFRQTMIKGMFYKDESLIIINVC